MTRTLGRIEGMSCVEIFPSSGCDPGLGWSQISNRLLRRRIGLTLRVSALHRDLVSLMEEGTEGFEIVRNTKTEVGLDAWRRLNHRYDPRDPLRNVQLLAPTQVGYTDVVANMERLQQEWFARDFGDDVQNPLRSILMTNGGRQRKRQE